MSGTRSHTEPRSDGVTQRFFTYAAQTLTPASGDEFVVWALLDPCDPPQEVMVQWFDGGWEHRAYWGADLIAYGTNGTPSRQWMGGLPPAGVWTRLSVPAAQVGLEGHTVNGMAFNVVNGKVWFDRVGYRAAGSGAVIGSPHTTYAKGESGRGVWSPFRDRQARSALSLGVRATLVEPGSASTGPVKQYFVYSPELNLLAETDLGSQPTVQYEYIWFAGQPVAQVETATNAVHYYFNDHLGTPILTTDSTGSIDWRIEREPYGQVYIVRSGFERHQPLALPGQEDREVSQEISYNIFRWYRTSWGRYTQADPIWETLRFKEFGSPYAYARDNPVRFTDPDGLDVRVCCRPLGSKLLGQILGYKHCYIESNSGGKRRTWGLHLINGKGVYQMNEPTDTGGQCSPWKPDPCPNNDCFTKAASDYPLLDYSYVKANLDMGLEGANSNTFVKCVMQKCNVPFVPPYVSKDSPGWYQPCP